MFDGLGTGCTADEVVGAMRGGTEKIHNSKRVVDRNTSHKLDSDSSQTHSDFSQTLHDWTENANLVD